MARIGLCLAALSAPSLAADGSDVPKVTFDDNVAPVFREKCFACHNPDKERGGLSLTTYARVMEGGSSGSVVEPGDPDGSRLYLLIVHKQEPHMPPKADKLPADQLEVVRQWIAGGALENSGSVAKASAKPKAQLSLAAPAAGKPEGPPPMPETVGIDPVLRTPRPGTLTAAAASPWAPLVALSGQKQVLLYHTESLELVGVLPFPEGVPQVLKFSRNGALLVAGGGHGSRSGRVVVWSVKTGERVAEVGDELDSVLAADISSDQERIALGGPSKVVRIFSTADGKVLAELRKHTDWIRALEFSPDGVLLATGDRAGGLWVWEAKTAREYLDLRGHEASVTDVSWRSDSNLLASASEDGTVRLWEMENGQQIKRWGAHGGGVLSVDFALDGRIATCGRDRVAKVWDGNGGIQKEIEALSDIATAVAWVNEGGRIVAGDLQGDVRVWLVADGKKVGSLALNPPTLAERVEAAQKEVAARQAEQEVAAKAAADAQAEVQRISAGLEKANGAARDAAAALERAETALAEARARAEKIAASKK